MASTPIRAAARAPVNSPDSGGEYAADMPNRAARTRLARVACLAFVAGCTATAARAEAPVYKDAELFREGSQPGHRESQAELWNGARRHPPRRTNRTPGYVGSDWGLGRPAYTGLGSRPDWGYAE
jgi:hypothetical protein